MAYVSSTADNPLRSRRVDSIAVSHNPLASPPPRDYSPPPPDHDDADSSLRRGASVYDAGWQPHGGPHGHNLSYDAKEKDGGYGYGLSSHGSNSGGSGLSGAEDTLGSVFTLKGWVKPSGRRRVSGKSKGTLAETIGGGMDVSIGEIKLLVGIIVLACVVRFWKISRPNSVVFDEVHFGGFAAKYIKTRFFMDVHPPLAKMLITLVAWLGRFDGGFAFKDIALEYPSDVPYVIMRMLPATLGVLLVPIAYLTLRGLACRPVTALLGSLLITFENGLITQSRHILLDSPLIFFTALTTFFWVGFVNESGPGPSSAGAGMATGTTSATGGSFTRTWWAWLILTGLSLGAVVSCKWVGLFTIALIGLSTVRQLWDLLGDLRVSMALLARHFIARAAGLIVVPLLFYMAMFQIHFMLLGSSGDGDGFMSSEFQHTLGGRKMEDTYADIMYGSSITIRHWATQGGYLHSHPHSYPAGSKQQQITLYPHRDDNNVWQVLNITVDDTPAINHTTHEPLEPIRHLAMIRLSHISTDKKLHSHDIRAPVSEVEYQNEVSAYGFPGFAGDANDNFVVEFDEEHSDTKDRKAMKQWRTLRTKFRLRHALTGCYLFSHKVKLPEWGFEQQEVTCNKNPSKPNSIWYAESNNHPLLLKDKKAPKINYRRPGFFAKFIELNGVMWRTNAGLTERHAYDSRPQSWPVLRRGINFWVKDHRQIYLIGNPFIWWMSTLSILVYAGVRGLLFLRAKRGYKDFNDSSVVQYDRLCAFLVLGWGLHYFPFFIMQRQLFLHHYFPALYFAILLLCSVFDFATRAVKPQIRLQVAAVFLIIAIWAYLHWSPLAYAGEWTKAKCETAKWLKTWDFSCADFYDNTSQYHTSPAASVSATLESAAPGVANQGAVPVHEKPKPADEAATTAAGQAVEPGRDVFKGAHVESEIPKSGDLGNAGESAAGEVDAVQARLDEEREQLLADGRVVDGKPVQKADHVPQVTQPAEHNADPLEPVIAEEQQQGQVPLQGNIPTGSHAGEEAAKMQPEEVVDEEAEDFEGGWVDDIVEEEDVLPDGAEGSEDDRMARAARERLQHQE